MQLFAKDTQTRKRSLSLHYSTINCPFLRKLVKSFSDSCQKNASQEISPDRFWTVVRKMSHLEQLAHAFIVSHCTQQFDINYVVLLSFNKSKCALDNSKINKQTNKSCLGTVWIA